MSTTEKRIQEYLQQAKEGGKMVFNLNTLKKGYELRSGEPIRIASGVVKSGKKDKYKIPATFSDETVDRYGDVILAEAFNTERNFQRFFNANNVMLWAHNMTEEKRAMGNIEEPSFLNKKFDGIANFKSADVFEFANEVWRLYDMDVLKTFSVGFYPIIVSFEPIKEGQDGWTFLEVELLEISAVPIPANPNALKKALNDKILSQETLEKQFAPFLKYCVDGKCYILPAVKSADCGCGGHKEEADDQSLLIKQMLTSITENKKKEIVPDGANYECSFCGERSDVKFVCSDEVQLTEQEAASLKEKGVQVIKKFKDFLGDEHANVCCPSCGVSSQEADDFALSSLK